MSPAVFLIILIIAVVLLVLFTVKLKINPVMSLFVIALLLGLTLGGNLADTMDKINKSFGSTLGSIGITIIFGAIIAMGIQDTGAATQITNFFIRLFRGKHLELAPSSAAFTMTLAVFGNVTEVLTAPITAIIGKRKHISMALVAPLVCLGLTVTHGLVPTHPGTLAVTALFGADVGQVMIWGIIISLIAFIVTYFISKPFLSRAEYIPANPQFASEYEEAPKDATVEEMCIKEEGAPSTFLSFMPLLVPLVLIGAGSIGEMFCKKGSSTYTFFSSIGNTTFALFVGVILVALLIIGRKSTVLKNAQKDDSSLTDKSSTLEISMNSWVKRAMKISIDTLIMIGMGGALGGILQDNAVVKQLGQMIVRMHIPAIIIPFVLAAVIMGATGSMTIAVMISASLINPMMGALALSPIVATLAICAGSMVLWHVNCSGFWMMTSLFNLNTKQGLKYLTTVNALGGIVSFIALCIFNALGVIA
ncbi:SLC13 family permease [Bifidobacterium sp. ESL0775]|uniref:GntP family permease n=1 Tax=Bifidobacterium sp. ESL0775 TaxID=2983230 RepID=UPI0023F9E5A6|nr:SLC13 family permease [Bifidobacterium sp. ESL0775]WEV68797.1 SLC13 family permease [Bifidobacterium sp. ESL0775]